MSLPATDELRGLLEWEPTQGVISAYLRVDHADRGHGWRIALRDALRDAIRGADGDERELEATAKRVIAVFDNGSDAPPDGRGQVVFAEIGVGEEEIRRFETMAVPRRPAVAVTGPRPHLQPLVELLDDYRSRGVVIVGGEHARILDWREGQLTEIEDREILITGDWRERKGPRNYDIPSGQSTSSSGRDQHEQRLDDHRRRFVAEVSEVVRSAAGDHSWRELVCFGEAEQLAELVGSLSNGIPLRRVEKNLISTPVHEILERLQELVGELNREREMKLIEAAEGNALAGGKGALGLVETSQALAEGRVEHLVLADAELPSAVPAQLVEAFALEGQPATLPTGELLIERALLTDAGVTPVEGRAAERLAERGGAAAILRY